MANTKSAEKAARQAVTRTVVNRQRASRIKTTLQNVEAAIASGKKADAQAAFRAATPVLMRGIAHGVTQKNTVSRKLSRLSKRIKALG
jgi:small subunit ribosomal protein S20